MEKMTKEGKSILLYKSVLNDDEGGGGGQRSPKFADIRYGCPLLLRSVLHTLYKPMSDWTAGSMQRVERPFWSLMTRSLSPKLQ